MSAEPETPHLPWRLFAPLLLVLSLLPDLAAAQPASGMKEHQKQPPTEERAPLEPSQKDAEPAEEDPEPQTETAALSTSLSRLPPLQIHALVSQGFLKSSMNNYLAESHRGSFEFTEVALNFTQPLSDTLRSGMQLFSRKLGPLGNYDARFDWFYLDWRRFDWLGVRAGRIKIPFGLYNEQSDYDPGRLTILLPQSVYPTTVRDFLLASTGVGVYGNIDLGRGGALSYNLVGGSIFIDVTTFGPQSTNNDVPYTFAGRVLWETPLQGLRLGASGLATKINALFDIRPGTPVFPTGGPVELRLPAVLWVASAEYVTGRMRFASEYSRWHLRLSTDPAGVIPETAQVSERFYVSSAFNATDNFEWGVYYAGYFPNVFDRTGRENFQHDLAVSFRVDLSEHWLVKVEPHLLHGTAVLSPALNDNRPRSALTETWVLLALKATAYF